MRFAPRFTGLLLAATLVVAVTAPASAERHTTVSRAEVVAFQAAGSEGGGVLVPGTMFPPTTHGLATLKRGADWIQVNIETSNLPAGAYTVWWVVFNNPDECSSPCNMNDLFNVEAQTSVFWATGGVVGESGNANFVDRYEVGESRGVEGKQDVIDGGPVTPDQAEIHNIIKYHGPASDDPIVLGEQTTTLLGSCRGENSNANAVNLGDPFGVHCFDPQAVVFHPLQ